MLIYDFFAHHYRWNPREVDELTLEEMFWLPVIAQARQEAQRQISKE